MSDIDNCREDRRRKIADILKCIKFDEMLRAAGKIDRAIEKINWDTKGWS